MAKVGVDLNSTYPGEMVFGLRERARRLATSQSAHDAATLEAVSIDAGSTRIRDCSGSERITVTGRLRSVTLRPSDRTPAVEADMYDGTGMLTLVFLGRRRIPGITAGRGIVAHGRPIVRDGIRTMVNPRYELLPTGTE